MPATRADTLPAIDVGAWVRAGLRVQGANPKILGGWQMDTVYGELHAGGKIHKMVSLTLNLNANGLNGTAGIEDAILGLDFADQFHIWLGQLLVPVDRPNYGGPFFAIPWNYPGFLTVGGHTVVMAPAEGPYGRNAGGSVWGDFSGFHYALGVFQSGDLNAKPLYSGRVSYGIVGQETGYFGNATYFGDKNLVAIGLGAQYKKDGSVGPKPTGSDVTAKSHYAEVNADALVELKYGGGGWVTLDGTYYHFDGKYNQITDAFYVLGAIATPPVGPGNIQPMVRYQLGGGKDGTPKAWNVDAFVTYLIKGPALHFTAGFSHTELGNSQIGNAIQIGAQGIFF
jgi:hypothetical protein